MLILFSSQLGYQTTSFKCYPQNNDKESNCPGDYNSNLLQAYNHDDRRIHYRDSDQRDHFRNHHTETKADLHSWVRYSSMWFRVLLCKYVRRLCDLRKYCILFNRMYNRFGLCKQGSRSDLHSIVPILWQRD